ncbi:serine/threonine-protein kinase ATR-like [Tubulanus polymorphus]|uniref:serine/threonine-protein kinase ATR-like n=1 Tax=Tubulanus polymorphus TaxID=672921 RepID=UPI003DA3B40B
MLGAILTLQDLKMPPNVCQTITWILTLPWLPTDMTWLDLKPSNSKEIGKLAGKLADKLNSSTLCEIIHVLAIMPKDYSPQWRAKVMKIAGEDSDENLRRAVIEHFPRLLYHYGPNGNHLVYDILHGILKMKTLSTAEQEMLANIYGKLACVISRKALLKSTSQSRLSTPCYENMPIQCYSCDDIIDEEGHQRSPHSRPKIVDPTMFLPFLNLLTSEQPIEVKTALVKSFKRLFGHIGVRANNPATVDMLNKCLTVIEDPDYNIRVLFSEAVQYLISDSKGDTTTETDQVIISKLKAAYERGQDSSNLRLQETILITLGHMGRIAEGSLLLVAVISLLESLLSAMPLISAVAYEQIQGVSKSKGVKMQALFMQFRHQICKFLGDAMHSKQMNHAEYSKPPLEMLQAIVNVFDFSDIKSFLKSTEKFLLPHLVSKATPAATAIIKILADELNQRRKKLLISSTKHIFSYIVRTCSEKQDLEKALGYLQNETGLEMGSLLRLDCQRVHNELLMYLSTHYSQVFQALAMLASNDDAYDGPKDITKSSDMARFLQPRLLGILASFDSTLLMTSVPLEEKKLALESLISIMKLMGQKYITTVRVKVMTTLRIGLRFKEAGFPEVSCRAWNCFVHSVELISLGPMLSQIVVTLLPLLYQLPKQVAEIFTFLTVENRKSLAQHLHELYFMPDLPELTEVNSVLRKYHEAAQRKADLSTKISNSLKGITHESLDVRLYALQKLKQLLRSQQKELHEYIMGKERTDPIISQMVSVLLNGCRETDMKTKALFGECLGEIGGIDPGRLDLKTHTSQDDAFQANVNDRNFTIYLINELARAFLAAEDTRTQDCSAFAIQEIIQIYEITDCVDGNLAGRKLWNCFPGHIQEILAPLLNSRYILNANVTSNWSNITKPIYHSRKGQSFKSWVCTWTGFLISKVVQEKALKVFQACSAVIKHNINIALYLLPHILLQVLLDSKDCTANEVPICCEILEVLRHVMKQESRQISVSDFRHMGAQTIFSVLDHLFKWKRHRLGLLSAKSSSMISRDISQDASYINDDNYRTVCEFVDKIPQDLLAHASYNCKAYTRAIMHLELFMRNNDRQNQQENLDFLQKLYVAMDEPDGVAGVAAIRQDNQTLDEQILLHTSIGQLQDATACYEQAIKLQPNDLSLHQGLLKCFMDLGQLNKALTHATGVISERPKWSNRVNSYRVEAAWKLAKWDDLQKFTAQETGNSNWGVGLGKILLAAKNKKENDFFKELEAVRLEQMGPLSAASMEAGSYQRGYEHIVRLHILNEIEQGVKTLLNIGLTDEVENTMNIAQIFSHWDSRLALTQSSFRTQDPILNVRAILITLANEESNDNLEKSLGQIWLQKARVARKADHVQTAYSSLLSASDFGLAEFWVEKAKWFYHKGDPDQAKAVLEKGVAKHYSDWKKFQTIDENDENVLEERLRYAKALLLIGRYSDETASVETNKIVRQFRDVIDVNPDWEGGYFYLAKYYDKVMTNMCDTAESRSGQKGCSGFLMHIVQNFGKSLQCGNQYIYQSMPRMLTLWLDYGAQVAEEQKMKKSSNQANLSQHNHMTALSSLNKLIEDFRVKIQPYQFLTALPQLISRICHAQPEVFNRLMSIISTVLGTYPQQSMWLMMAVSKSSVTVRVKRCIEIFSRAKQANPDLVKFLADATKLVDRLLELCNKPVEKNVTTLSISQHFKSLKRLVDDKNFSSIMLPLQSTLTPSLPITPGCHADHNPFPGQQVYLSGFEDAVDILHSLQKPKKITMRGSDGKPYIMMCKPKDDLRKDCRLMEFNGIVNKCLRKDPESRKRNLHIRTYAVIPLNEECGLLEWVPHTHGFRHILTKSYKERGNFMTPREVFAVKPTLQMSTESKLHIYKSKLLPRHPPVFSEWFLQTFPDPTSWYMARLSYARTAAVMSMVGYILGLGDRHGENILFDSTTGDCVHVDFNCLFNKGEGFDWPELVPFRLTHNMVDALGPTGYEGIFRTACEVTMRLMRNEKDPLMSVLKTFIYDPLVEWSKPVKSRNEQSAVTRGGKVVRANEFGEIKNEMAQSNVQNIEHRLNGITKNNTVRRGLPLSIEGQVNYLIQEAISEANLCKMYIGWSAYM